MSTPIEITAIVSMIVIGIVLLVEIFIITALMLTLKNLISELRERMDPLIDKTNQLLITANEVAASIQERTEHLADRASHTGDAVGAGVERAAQTVQRVIAAPVVTGTAVAAGLRRGWAIWRARRAARRQESPPPAG